MNNKNEYYKTARYLRGENFDALQEEIKTYKELMELEKSQQIKREKTTKNSKSNNKRKKLSIALVGTSLVLVAIPEVKELNYQHQIDKANEAKIVLEIPDNVNLTKEARDAAIKAFMAERIYTDKNATKKEINQAEQVIYNYMQSGYAQEVAEAILDEKIIQAATYGDCKEYDNYNSDKGVELVKNEGDVVKKDGIRIKGVKGNTYYTEFSPFDKKLPKNLSLLVEDILDYGSWDNANECIKSGVEIIQDSKAVTCEYYLLSKNGKLERVNDKDFDKKKEKVEREKQEKEDKVRENIYEKYGIVAKSENSLRDNIEK